MNIPLKRFQFFSFFLLLVFIIGCNDSGGEETPLEVNFTNGMFIATNEPPEITFHTLGNEADNNLFSNIDIYSYVNEESLEGTIKDLIVEGKSVYVLISGDTNQIIELDIRSMKKKNSITIDIQLPEKFLIHNNKAYISNLFSVFAVDLSNGNTITEFNQEAGNGFGSMIIHNNNLFYSSELPYGKITQIDLSTNQYVATFNIGHTPNSFLFLENGDLIMTLERGANFFNTAFNTSEFLNPNIHPGIVSLNISTQTVTQVAVSKYPYPKHLSRENNSFNFIQFEEKSHPFDSSIQIWNQANSQLSPEYKINFFGGNNNGYNGMKTLKLKNSKFYVIVKNAFYIMDIESNNFETAFSKTNAVKLIFIE